MFALSVSFEPSIDMIPTKIKQPSTTELSIEWNDGHKGIHTHQVLRRYCPCASCKLELEEREATALLPILTPGKNELKSIETVGNYALQLRWADGHSTGIYTYDYLRQLCECDRCKKINAE
jgi:DUF971 family protein